MSEPIASLPSMLAASVWEWMRPELLAWLLIAIPVLLWFHVRSLSDFPVWQRRVSLAVRIVVVLLLTLALTGLVWLRATQRQMIVVAIDRSASIDAAAGEVADRFAETLARAADLREDIELRFLEFDRVPGELTQTHRPIVQEQVVALEQSDSESEDTELDADAERPAKPAMELEPEPEYGTDMASALRTAAAAIPPRYVSKVVLVSDGNETFDDGVAAATSAGMPIFTVPLPGRSEPEVQVASLRAPAQVRQGEPFYLEVVVNSNTDTTGMLDVYRGDIRIGDEEAKPIEVKAGETKFRIRQTVTGQRQVTFAARLRGFGDSDTLLDNNEQSAIVAASGRPRVLLIDPDTDQTDSLRWALDEQKIDVEVRPPAGVPQSLSELQGYECLILSNVPATAMTMRQMDVIRTYVQDLGGGLVMMGGDQSFGLGGYYRTQLEEILPVRSNFEKEREKPSLAMVLVIDKSGSMGGEKIELAKDAARAAVELLGPRDSIGVIAFDGESYWINELRSASDKGYVIDQIATIDAGGGTNMYPAMSDAYEALAGASAKLKHCIMLTDGISSPGDFEGMAGEMAASRMTVSTVALGQGSSEELLEDIARIGGGRYYFCDDPQSIPQVFAKETVEASKSAINELPFLPQVVRPTQVLEGIDLEFAPLLLGYVVTRPKPTCEFVLASESGDPLLAWWRYGLGMTVAFTSDAKARWAAEWLAWPDFGPFWAQVIRHAMRKSDARGIFVDIQTDDERTTVQMDVVDDDGNFIDERPTTVTLIDPQLKLEKIEMRQTAAGRYEAELPSLERGTYQLDLAQVANDGTTVRQSRGLAIGYPEELRLRPTDEAKLTQISEVSGGRFGEDVEAILATDDRTARDPVPMWPWLLMAAVSLFIADVGLRRIEWTQA
ncbi:VWA domain-containing protein [Neorhodopirellula pilleata]|uniref:von Willebrand factor type A domain protein n=1 Tax=Neorhodopirellula pilleata TaxID=2714738 RepID=A0A5C6AHY0_9BACT|nr:VWA domain-containing protein [Neorhodopirellula pilleata]TWT99010.1 von Willebrand factor type A domain protein [Neorhodopirellula pilleata]